MSQLGSQADQNSLMLTSMSYQLSPANSDMSAFQFRKIWGEGQSKMANCHQSELQRPPTKRTTTWEPLGNRERSAEAFSQQAVHGKNLFTLSMEHNCCTCRHLNLQSVNTPTAASCKWNEQKGWVAGVVRSHDSPSTSAWLNSFALVSLNRHVCFGVNLINQSVDLQDLRPCSWSSLGPQNLLTLPVTPYILPAWNLSFQLTSRTLRNRHLKMSTSSATKLAQEFIDCPRKDSWCPWKVMKMVRTDVVQNEAENRFEPRCHDND